MTSQAKGWLATVIIIGGISIGRIFCACQQDGERWWDRLQGFTDGLFLGVALAIFIHVLLLLAQMSADQPSGTKG